MRRPPTDRAAFAALLPILLWGSAAAAACGPAEGFARPSDEIEVAAAEPGLLADVSAREGRRVQAGALLARLDARVAEAELAAVEARAASTGRLTLARERRDFALARLEEIDKLRRSGAVRPLEILEARSNAAVAEAELQVARDEANLARLDVDRARARLRRLEVRAPLSGVIDEVRRDAGEFLGAADPVVATLIVLDPLNADVFLPSRCLDALSHGDAATIRIDGVERPATVRDIGRRVDAPTGLLRLGLSIANPGGDLRAGDRISVVLPEPSR